jgi:AraC family carnitine catabolism transcriptional activator
MAVSTQLLHERLRSSHDHQRTAAHLRLEQVSPRLAAAVKLMEDNIERPLTLSEIATQTGLVQRQLERLFKRHFGTTPKQHYVGLRLDRAGLLLESTSMPIVAVAVACGFVSAAHFSHRYRERFGASPTVRRREAQQRRTES